MTPERRERLDQVLAWRQPDLTLVAENLHKPRNFSAVLRTCDAVGINDVHAVHEGGQPPRHWHTAQGAVKWVRVHTHDTVRDACESVRDQGFRILAAHLSGQALDYREVDYTRPTALLVGTELFGVSNDALRWADQEVQIPMMGMSQSLNVSVACALVLYEALAQRRAAGLYDSSRMDPGRHRELRFEWLHPQLADYCRRHGLDYPELDREGELLEDLPRGFASKG